MRLTLRTLLAYLDDILDPADKEELTKKVESSDFAAELIHRTRDTTRRLRLSAPQVVGTGMGLDPNTVAEYLDNALPPDSLGDFERICLESDMHLAEVASCHHVLTMVLGEPADVDANARVRMYAIPSGLSGDNQVRVEPAHAPAVATPPPQPVAVEAPAPARVSQNEMVNQSILMEVPDYLRASGWARYRTAIIGLAALLLIGAAVLLLPGVRGFLGGDATPQNGVADGGAKSGVATNNVEQTPRMNEPDRTGGTQMNGGLPQPKATTPSPETAFPAPLLPRPVITDPATTTPIGQGTPTNPAGAGAAAPGDQGMQTVGTPAMPNAGGMSMTVPEMPTMRADSGTTGIAGAPGATGAMPPIGMTPAMPVPPADNRTAMSPATDVNSMNQGATQPPMPTPPVMNIGTYLGGKSILLRYHERAQSWFRMEPRAAVVIGDRLLALPDFRPRVKLASGVDLDVAGGSQVAVKTADLVVTSGLPAGDPQMLAIDVVYGRIVLINTSPDEQRVRLTTGLSTADIRLARNAVLGVQVSRGYIAGVDPRRSPSPVLAEFIAPAGGIVWSDPSGERPITDAARWMIADGLVSAPAPLLKPVEWLDHEPATRSSDQIGANSIERALTVDRPADEQLLAIYDEGRQREVKYVAARYGTHVGMFVPLVRALRDNEQRPNWRNQLDTLRVAMALNPASADEVWQTLVKERDLRAASDLYEMLCGYSSEQVGRTPEQRKNPTGPLARLINWLSSDNPDYRVLAAENLWDITAKRLMTNAAGNQTERANGIREWTRRLATDELLDTRTTNAGQ